MAQFALGPAYNNEIKDIEQIGFDALASAPIRTSTATEFQVDVDDGDATTLILLTLTGTGFTYGANGRLTGGIVTGIKEVDSGELVAEVTGLNMPVATLMAYITADNDLGALADLLGGADVITGSAGRDFLRGFEGDDQVSGGAMFDRLNGNQGADTVSGGDGGDWVRGGRGDDSVSGNAGDDFVSGDRGNDTLSGGAGADVFNSFGDAGVDRVIDFSAADRDRVRLEAGSTYTVVHTDSDTVITVDGSAQVLLVGVMQSSLTAGWLFVG